MRERITRWIEENLDRTMNLYPPYLGAGVRIAEMADDMRYIRVEMPLRFYNRNYVGTHFGGSLYSMCDPFYMLMLLKNLGPDYIVWDRSASIDFKKPGTGTVTAEFKLPKARLEKIRHQADTDYKVEPSFEVDIVDEDGDVVASVAKVLYIRRKDAGDD